VPTLAGLLALALGSGVNLYATALTLGLSARFGWISGLPPELGVLGHPLLLTLAGTLYAVEFIADKVPFITPVWDAIHTFIRPLGAALLASQAAAELDPVVRVAAVLLSGSVALAAHSGKMGARLAAHSVPDPVTHSAISIAEDFGVVSVLVLAWQHPLIALPVLIVVLLGLALLLRVFYRAIKGHFVRIRGWFLRAQGRPDVV
jgi:hypothetical protein